MEKKFFVHESSYIDENVEIGQGSKIWHFSHILKNSKVGNTCVIGQNVAIGPDVIIGNNCKVQNNVSIYKGVTLEDKEINELLAGKDYTTQVTLFGNIKIEDILEDQTILSSTRRFTINEEDVDELNVVVTITFEDGSGYNIPVDWKNWTVGEPEFAEQVSPPEDLIRIGPKFTSREDIIQSR